MMGRGREGASLVAQMVKNLPVMQETQVQSLAWEDPMEKEMATHFSILAWRIPSMGWQRDTTERLTLLPGDFKMCAPSIETCFKGDW